jgi:N-dimethylarginine dimethylaminohydrolase
MSESPLPPAYGGPGWQGRESTSKQELGSIWGSCGLDSEWRPLRQVLLHRPGRELQQVTDNPASSLMLDTLDPAGMSRQHDGLAETYRKAGVGVSYVRPPSLPPPNQLFAADLFAMTPEGAILGRPASAVRAGEERWVARALSGLGIPILLSVRGGGTFEGADLMWLRPDVAMLAEGFRTNEVGAGQVQALLQDLGVEILKAHLPPGTMHLMGQLRIVDEDLAIVWRNRLPEESVEELRSVGFEIAYVPSEEEARSGFALNFVVLGPRIILMPGGNPETKAFYEELGIECCTVDVAEISKAAGSIGCLTGVLERDPTPF